MKAWFRKFFVTWWREVLREPTEEEKAEFQIFNL